jgi:serine/threonine protein kinase
MPLSPGDKLGPYVIVAPLGAGGMGEVYRARDAKLKRDVAIKVLPAALASYFLAQKWKYNSFISVERLASPLQDQTDFHLFSRRYNSSCPCEGFHAGER